MRGDELLAWIASLPEEVREREVEAWLGVGDPVPASTPPGDHLVGYHATGVDAVLVAISEIPIGPNDVVLDLGAGLGKVALLVHLLTGARARGIELQPELVTRARAAAAACDARGVRFEHGDVRTEDLGDADVFFMYLPFTGPVLVDVLERLRAIARTKRIVVCTLGLDIDRHAPWLARRAIDSFWLAIYDSA